MRFALKILVIIFSSFTQHVIAGQIHIDAKSGNIDSVYALIREDKELVRSITADEFLMPIHLAAQFNHAAIVRLLHEHGSPVDPLDKNKASPLFRASLTGSYECAVALIKSGANVNAVGDEEIRPIHLAAMNGHYEIVKGLIEHGADTKAKDVTGITPYDLAATNEIKTLLSHAK